MHHGHPVPTAPPRVSSRSNTTTRENPGPHRPAQCRTGPGANRRTRLARQPRVEFPREIRASGLEYLISTPEFTDLAFQLGDPLLILGRGAGTLAFIDFRLLQPGSQRFRMNIKLPAHPGDLPVPL